MSLNATPAPENLPMLVELMSAWAEEWEVHALRHGAPLDDEETEDAVCVGVREPSRVRVLDVPNVPLPPYPILLSTLIESKIISPHAFGLSLRYGIFIRNVARESRRRWLVHELAHTTQFERLGGFTPTFERYLGECLTVGYESSSLEHEADADAERCLEKHDDTPRTNPVANP